MLIYNIGGFLSRPFWPYVAEITRICELWRNDTSFKAGHRELSAERYNGKGMMIGHNPAERLSRPSLGLVRENIRRGGMLIALVLGVGSILFFYQPALLCAGSSRALRHEIALLSIPGLRFLPPFPNPGTPQPKQDVESAGSGRTAIRDALEGVKTSNPQELAGALGITAGQINSEAFGTSEAGMKVLGDLDEDGVPEVVANWKPPEQGGNGTSTRAPNLYLLSWDGKAWRASHLMKVVNAFEIEILPGTESGERLMAVVVFQGSTAVPYPIIFEYQDHAARMLWDGRSDSSLYTGYDYGVVQFKKAEGGGFPEMLASGRADPGLLVFPKRSGADGRGFEETRIYAWRSDAYVPVETAYTPNPDYTLYRFIAALHLHNFQAAYSLIDPPQFLKTAKPSLKLFRERIEKDWPEFLDDQIFQVPGDSQISDSHVFTLMREDGKTYLYSPSFTPSPAYLLSGLNRKEVSE